MKLQGASVLDLGCGVGILGALALEAGAARVTALDHGPVIEFAREAVERAAGPGKVRIVQERSELACLDERFDLVLCDHVGYFGFDYGIVAFVQDARRRFLKPGGRVMPAWIDLYLAPVHLPHERSIVDACVAPEAPAAMHGLHRYAINARHPAKVDAEALLGEPALLGRIDLRTDNADPFAWAADMRVTREGRFDGFAGWFDCGLTDSVRMTNSPLDAGRIDRPQAFLPVAEPMSVSPGETLSAEIVARPADDLIAWTVRHSPSGRRFRHSTFDGMIFTRADLRRAIPSHVPRPTAKARARAIVLGYCDGTRTRADIEAAVLADHPALFPTPEAISRFVGEVLERDTE